jgi:hypothetical protein
MRLMRGFEGKTIDSHPQRRKLGNKNRRENSLL